jgi:DGQHR domain-containing protein
MSATTLTFPAKRNQDGSYSVSVEAEQLVTVSYVDFYNEATGQGYQRLETLRERRGREVEDYLKRCKVHGIAPRLFEMTANARTKGDRGIRSHNFEPLEDHGTLGILTLELRDKVCLSMIDGGTRLLGIEKGLSSGAIRSMDRFDLRLFVGLTVPEEVAMFLLINEQQKRVRTDLSVRVVQGLLDEGKLTSSENKTLQTVVPETDAWRYEASRIAARLNADIDSPWRGLIQMPNDKTTRPIKLQALWSSMDWLLTDAELKTKLEARESEGLLTADGSPVSKTDFLVKVLKNFWGAVQMENPRAFREPMTNVLVGSIGASACHMALARLLSVMIEEGNVGVEKFRTMVRNSEAADYAFWFNRKGTAKEEYPGERGPATTMIGHSGYLRGQQILEKAWRSNLYADTMTPRPVAA